MAEDIDRMFKLEQTDEVFETPVEQGYGRIERKETSVYQQRLPDHILDEQCAGHIQTAIRVERSSQTRNTATGAWESSEEKAVYAANGLFTTTLAHRLIRDHWGIKNKSHYVKDVSFHEDSQRIRKHSFNFSILISMALNFSWDNEFVHIKQQRYAFSLDWTQLYSYTHII